MRGLRLTTVALLAGTLLAACGDDDTPSRAAPTPATLPPASQDTAGPTGSGAGGYPGEGNREAPEMTPAPTATAGPSTKSRHSNPQPDTTTRKAEKGGGSRLIKWIKNMGITGGGDPEGDVSAYASLANGECARVFDVEPATLSHTSTTLYQGAAYACLAAFNGRGTGWAAAERRYQELAAEQPDLDCIGEVTFSMLRDLVEAHRADPAARFNRSGQGRARDPHCPRILRLDPGHGPLQGGYQVRLTGEHLPKHAMIEWGERSYQVATNGTTATLEVPPGDEPGGVYVYVDGWPWHVFGSPQFDYDPP
jgi:hypothetical protein